MISNEQRRIAFLDGVRMKRGRTALVESFRSALQADSKKALEYLNDKDLCFPSFYSLFGEITGKSLDDQLCDRNRAAAEFVRDSNAGSYGDAQTVHAMLKWMVKTDENDDMENGYFQKIDTAAAMLTSVYGDKSVLPFIVDGLFTRYRKGLPYHYLAWAFFEARDPYSLAMIADRLRSSDKNENECGCRLLSFIPDLEEAEREQQYHRFCEWLEENGPYLWYKGETFDTTHRPEPYVIVLGAKYLGHFVSMDSGTPYASLTKKESRLLRQFHDLIADEQSQLASLSARKRLRNREKWHEWLQLPIKKQLKAGEGGNDFD